MWGVGFTLLILLWCLPKLYAQEDPQLQLVSVDISAFPTVRVTLLTADSRSAPVDLSGLSLRENGTHVTDLTFANVPSGVDVIFVLDANVGFNEIDDDTGLTRREKVRESIRRFIASYMNPDRLDAVSIVVPGEDGQSGRFLVKDAVASAEVIEAINAYEPATLGPTPLNDMLSQALDHAQQRKNNGRYKAILLFTDGRRLDQQLSFPLLVAQANDAITPIYAAILGESADPNEIANVSRLNEPTRAFYVHMFEPEATDPIYQIWQQQSNPVQVEYRSRQRQSGRNQLTLNLGPAQVNTSFEVLLAAPEVELSLGKTQIHRVGVAPNTPLDALQPTVLPVTLILTWPDGMPRQIDDVTLLVDEQPKRIPDRWQDDTLGPIELNWDISGLEEGSYELAANVTDELGYQGASQPVRVDVTIYRPLPPTPMPTAIPSMEITPEPLPAFRLGWEELAGIVLILLLVFVLLLLFRRKAAANAKEQYHLDMHDSDGGTAGSSEDLVLFPALEPLAGESRELLPIREDNITIGSQAQTAQIVLEDESVARLHARVRRQDHSYWLFDEGSAEGTYLNYERLGLAPRELSDGDILQFGKVGFRFCLRESNEMGE